VFVKTKQNQQFRTIDFLGLIVSCVAVVGIITPIVRQTIGAEAEVKAVLESENLAQNLIRKDFRTLGVREPSSREPASFVLSKTLNQTDPWGRPYHYKVGQNQNGQPAFLIVWSAGPNGDSESDDVEVLITDRGSPEVAFKGDDKGSLVPVR
jgi:hypothetical protein